MEWSNAIQGSEDEEHVLSKTTFCFIQQYILANTRGVNAMGIDLHHVHVFKKIVAFSVNMCTLWYMHVLLTLIEMICTERD